MKNGILRGVGVGEQGETTQAEALWGPRERYIWESMNSSLWKEDCKIMGDDSHAGLHRGVWSLVNIYETDRILKTFSKEVTH